MANDSYILLILVSRQHDSKCNILFIAGYDEPMNEYKKWWSAHIYSMSESLSKYCADDVTIVNTMQFWNREFHTVTWKVISNSINIDFIRIRIYGHSYKFYSMAKPEINAEQTVHMCFILCSFRCFHVAGPSLALFRFTLHVLLETQLDGGSDYTPPLLGMGLLQREVVWTLLL